MVFFWWINIIATKMEWNDPVVGQIPHFGPFPFEKLTTGVPKRWKTNLHQICFSNPRMIWYHKGSHPVLFWDEKRSCLGRGGLLCVNSVPNFELDFCPDHWGGPFVPKLHEPSNYIIQTWFVLKKSHFRTYAPSTPSIIFLMLIGRLCVVMDERQ